MTAPFLALDNVAKSFRGLRAVDGVSFGVEKGSITALIGPNGAGKTTVFNLISGMFQLDSGSVTFDGKTISGLRPDQICAAGIGRTFQIVKPFKDMTVEENVMVGALRATSGVEEARAEVGPLLQKFDLWKKRNLKATSLTLPDRKRLEVVRAMATKPRLLLLDEVMAGLRPTETDQMVAIFQQLNRETGLTILLIEHVMRAVMRMSQHIVVVSYGKKIAEGLPDDIVRNKDVLDCYLGEGAV
ncbi:MAG: ABC transporter ATP-binding protein [Beijerinckiaceae bacterium]